MKLQNIILLLVLAVLLPACASKPKPAPATLPTITALGNHTSSAQRSTTAAKTYARKTTASVETAIEDNATLKDLIAELKETL